MSCDNCQNCYVLKISERLRTIYDWSSNGAKVFEKCGKEDCYFFDNKKENVLCFTKRFAKTLNWKNLENFYMSNKEKIDKELGFDKG